MQGDGCKLEHLQDQGYRRIKWRLGYMWLSGVSGADNCYSALTEGFAEEYRPSAITCALISQEARNLDFFVFGFPIFKS